MKKDWFKHLFALLLFGSNGIVASYIELNSVQIVLLRTLIGSLLLVVFFLASGGRFTFYKKHKQFLFLAASGIAMGASWMFLYEAYDRVGVSVATLLYYCGPIIVMLFSSLLFGERLGANAVFGFLAVFAGVVLINGNILDGKSDWFGVVCGLLSALTYAIMVICNKKAADIVGLENAALQLVVAFLTVAVFSAVKHTYSMHIQPSNILPILLLGIVNTGIGCYFYFSSIGKLPVQTVAICGYMEPLSAVLFSAVFLQERLLTPQIVGAVCILGGAAVSELFKATAKKCV